MEYVVQFLTLRADPCAPVPRGVGRTTLPERGRTQDRSTKSMDWGREIKKLIRRSPLTSEENEAASMPNFDVGTSAWRSRRPPYLCGAERTACDARARRGGPGTERSSPVLLQPSVSIRPSRRHTKVCYGIFGEKKSNISKNGVVVRSNADPRCKAQPDVSAGLNLGPFAQWV